MKKFILSLTFVTLFSLFLRAQITVKPGGGFHYLTPTHSTNNWDRFGGMGYQAGSTVKIGRLFYGEAGVFWMSNFSEFSQIESESGTGPIRLTHQLNMLRIPLLAGYSIWDSQGSSLDFNVVAGPVFNVVLGVDNSVSNTSAPAKADYQPLFWGGNIGLNLTYWWLFLDTGFEFGFSGMYHDAEKYGKAKANVFYLNFGVRIRL